MSELGGLAWPEVALLAGADPTLLIPLGATEQHGPHLPLSTDTDIALAIVMAVTARRAGVIAAPAVPYGSSGEHAGFAGTLSIGQSVVESLLVELCRSATMTFARVVLVSTHGGNAGPVNRAVATLRAEGRVVRAWEPRWDGDAHAGQTETSLMLAIAPGRVQFDRATAGIDVPAAELLPRVRVSGVRAVSPSGVLGDPTRASRQEGHALLGQAVDQLDAMLTRLEAA